MNMLRSYVLLLSAAILILTVHCDMYGKKRNDYDVHKENDWIKDHHDVRSATPSGYYESKTYVDEMSKYQQIQNERASKGEPFYRKADVEYVAGTKLNLLTPAQQNQIISLHNDLRKMEGGSDMSMLRYNPKLAELAQQWAERCQAEHGQVPFDADEVGWNDLGQSYSAHADKTWTPLEGVKGWFMERKDFDYNTAQCRGVCGHYIQLVWGSTTDIGCGIAYCPMLYQLGYPAHFMVCNYGPAGNEANKQPFTKGPACTQCASGSYYCNNGLCDNTCKAQSANCECKADCKRGGTRTSDCRCKCKEDSLGLNCADPCQDLDPQCGQNPGYPDVFCQMTGVLADTVRKSCPKLCGSCKA